MAIKVRLQRDDVLPSLQALGAKVANAPRWLRAAGTEVVSIAKRAFRNPELRGSGWASMRSGEPSNLIKKGMLVSSVRITQIDSKNVSVGSDRKYAAIHQLGGTIRPKQKKVLVFQIGGRTIFAKRVRIPPRPYLPFDAAGKMLAWAEKRVRAVILKALQ